MEKDHAQIDEIKTKVDITTLVGQYVQLKKAGQNYKGLCPFHSEKTPSFMVNPKIGIFKCFGCNEGGDIFTFVEKVENVDFVTALKILADKAGVVIQATAKSQSSIDNDLFIEINRKVADFYHDLLVNSPIGKAALEFVVNGRKMTRKSIDEFKLGLAPGSNNELLQWARDEKLDLNLLVKLNLLNYREGRYFDWFRNRIMFPIFDVRGNVVGFSGRSLGDGEPKYLNSPESPVFNKSKTLFGLNLAKTEIKKQGFIIMVEGNFDVVASFQAGARNSVAPLGTAATERHLLEIKKWTTNLYIAFDNDKAGFSATNRLAEVAIDNGFDLKVVVPKFGKDPDECIKTDPESWVESIEGALTYYDYLITKAAKSLDLNSADGKKKFSQVIFPLIRRIDNPLEKNHYIRKIGNLLDENEAVISRMIATEKAGPTLARSSTYLKAVSKAPTNNLIDYLFYLVFEIKQVPNELTTDLVETDVDQQLLNLLVQKENFDIKLVRNQASSEVANRIDQILLIEVDDDILADNDKIANEIKNILSRLRRDQLKKKLKDISLGIKQAEITRENDKLKLLQKEFTEVAQSLKNIS